MLDIESIKAREQAATKGPWYPMWGGEPNMISAPRNDERDLLAEFYGPSHDGRCPDADFAAHAREDIRALIAEVERMRNEADVLVEIIEKHADEVERLQGIINTALSLSKPNG